PANSRKPLWSLSYLTEGTGIFPLRSLRLIAANALAEKGFVISASREHFPEPVFPLSISYIASALLQIGAHVRIFDAGLHHFYNYSLQRELIRFKPDVIGLSLRNIDNAAYPRTRSYL